jgi:hypothetical protein
MGSSYFFCARAAECNQSAAHGAQRYADSIHIVQFGLIRTPSMSKEARRALVDLWEHRVGLTLSVIAFFAQGLGRLKCTGTVEPCPSRRRFQLALFARFVCPYMTVSRN